MPEPQGLARAGPPRHRLPLRVDRCAASIGSWLHPHFPHRNPPGSACTAGTRRLAEIRPKHLIRHQPDLPPRTRLCTHFPFPLFSPRRPAQNAQKRGKSGGLYPPTPCESTSSGPTYPLGPMGPPTLITAVRGKGCEAQPPRRVPATDQGGRDECGLSLLRVSPGPSRWLFDLLPARPRAIKLRETGSNPRMSRAVADSFLAAGAHRARSARPSEDVRASGSKRRQYPESNLLDQLFRPRRKKEPAPQRGAGSRASRNPSLMGPNR
jgi:hypothetical protein